MISGPRLPRAIVLAGVCALLFATHVFLDFTGVRAKVVRSPVAASGGLVTAQARPEVLRDLQSPFAVIARIHNDDSVEARFDIQIDGVTVCAPAVSARSTQRVDCSWDRRWDSHVAHDVSVRSSATAWTLNYLELATHDGASSGALTLVVLPASSKQYVKPGAALAVFVWILLIAVLALPAASLPRPVAWLHAFVVAVFAVVTVAALISPLVSRYSLVVNVGSFWLGIALAVAPRLYWVARGPLQTFARWRPAWLHSDDAGLAAGARALDAAAGLLLLFGLWIELTGPTPPVHVLGVLVSLGSADAPVFLALLLLWSRHRSDPRHSVLARLFPRPASPVLDDEARLFRRNTPIRRDVIEAAAVTLAFSALVAVATWPQVARLDSVPDLGDPLFSVWRIAWIAHQLVRAPLHLFDGNMFYPERLTLAYSDPVIVPGLMSAPFFWLGANRLAIYNLLFLSGFALSGVTTYYLVRALTGRRAAAAVSGIVFALYPFRFEHYSHLELQMTMWMPLALWGLHRTLASGRVRDGVLTGAAVALQALSSLYDGLFLLAYMVVLAGVIWMARRKPMTSIRPALAGLVVLGVLVAPVAIEFIRDRPMFGQRQIGDVEFYSANAVDYLKPHFRSWLYGGWSQNGHPERQLFPGFAAVALALFALRPPVKSVRLAYAAGMALAFDASLGVHGVTFPLLRDFVPPFLGLRVPARFSILVGLSLAVLAGLAAKDLLDRLGRWRPALLGLLLAMVVVDPWPHLTLQPVWPEPPPIYGSLPTVPPAVLAEFPIPVSLETFAWDARYLYFSTFHWQRLVNGNSGISPPSYIEFLDRAKTFPDDAAIDYLRGLGVEYVSVHGAFYTPDEWRRLQDALARQPALQLVAAAPWGGSESRLYRLRR